MQHKNSSIVTLAFLLLAGATQLNAVAQTSSDQFALPKTVPSGTKVQIDGSNSMKSVNQGLKERFQQQFPGTDITLPASYQGSDAGVKAVAAGKADLASIGRWITKAELDQGVAAKAIGRSKIAIIVKDNNPYKGNLTLKDFAKIYRGEITDWSQLASAKGAKGKIKVIDRPDNSDTRRAFANYPVFQKGKLKTGANAQKLTEDSTTAMVAKLDQEGIGYAPADQVKNIPGIRAITLHGTQPDNPKYPFSQPLVYAYKNKDGKVTDGAKAFLGYVGDPTGKKGVAESIASGVKATAVTGTDPAGANPTNSIETDPVIANRAEAIPEAATTTTSTTMATTSTAAKGGLPWWWMIPTLVAGGGLLWFLNRQKPNEAIDQLSTSYAPTRKSTTTSDRPSTGYISTSPTTGTVDATRLAAIENLSPDLRHVWLAVNHEPTNFESIVTNSQHSDNYVTDALSQLESMNLVTQLPGRRYQRAH
jgi:phosphate transport system substrate-binding protein